MNKLVRLVFMNDKFRDLKLEKSVMVVAGGKVFQSLIGGKVFQSLIAWK